MNRIRALASVLIVFNLLGTEAISIADGGRTDPVGCLIDPSLVQSLHDAPPALMDIKRPPYVAHFQKNGVNLLVVAAHHESHIGNETCKVIERVFDRFPVHRVIVEGHRNADGELEYDKWKDPNLADENRRKIKGGEGGFALELAQKRGISVIGGEPTFRAQAEAALSAGHKWEDVLGIEFIKIMSPGHRKKHDDKRSPAELFKVVLGYLRKEMQVPDSISFSLADFYAWFHKHTGEKFDPEKVEFNKYLFTPQAKSLREIGEAMNNERNRFLAKAISADLHKYKCILVVYGSGHYACLQKAIEASFGKPVYEGNFGESWSGVSQSQRASIAKTLAASGCQRSPQKVRFISSEVFALVAFIDYLASFDKNNKRGLYSEFRKKHKQSDKETRLLERFKTSIYDKNWNKIRELQIAAASCRTCIELEHRLPACLSATDKQIVIEALQTFEPIFRAEIWSKLAEASEERTKIWQQHVESTQLGACLDQVKNLCQSEWPASIPLTVAVLMVPDELHDDLGRDGNCKGQLVHVESMPKRCWEQEYSTMFHELCHSLWLTRSSKTVQKLKKYFKEADGMEAYYTFIEAFPTAMGSGWFAQHAYKAQARYWHGNMTIRTYSELLQPLLEKYLSDGRSFDREFGVKAVRLFRSMDLEAKKNVPYSYGNPDVFFTVQPVDLFKRFDSAISEN